MSTTLILPGTPASVVRLAGGRRRPMVRIVTLAAAPTAVRARASMYEVLRVKDTASAREIKAAYRAMAKRFHPDVAGGAAVGGPGFLEIHRAYATLYDPASRARYDRSIRLFEFAGEYRLRSRRWETDQCW